MKTSMLQKQKPANRPTLDEIAGELVTVTNILTRVLEDMKSIQTDGQVKLSVKAQKSIEKGLKDLEKGRYTIYKDFNAFRKSYG